jgi:hypothetical protein
MFVEAHDQILKVYLNTMNYLTMYYHNLLLAKPQGKKENVYCWFAIKCYKNC